MNASHELQVLFISIVPYQKPLFLTLTQSTCLPMLYNPVIFYKLFLAIFGRQNVLHDACSQIYIAHTVTIYSLYILNFNARCTCSNVATIWIVP